MTERRYSVRVTSPRWEQPKVVLRTNAALDAHRRFRTMVSRKQADVMVELLDKGVVTHTAHDSGWE